MKHHVNNKGDVGVCRARKQCPFGGEESHFSSVQEAREAYETLMQAKEFYGINNVFFHTFKLTPSLEKVIKDLNKVGNPLIVGGAVRDSLVGAESKDIDIEVHGADLDAIGRTLRSAGYNVDEVGKQFGVLKVSKKGVIDDLDISVPRRENQVGAHHREFEVEVDTSMSITEAGSRRDFTFNALYYDPNRKLLLDPYNGKQDFENKILRHVSEKFSEDPLRVLRAVQFAARFDLIVAPSTAKLGQELRNEYATLSKERVQEEWAKFFSKGKNPRAGLEALKTLGWDNTEPELESAIEDSTKLAKDLARNNNNLDAQAKIYMGAGVIARTMTPSAQEHFIRKIVEGKKNQALALDLLRTKPEFIATEEARKHYAYKLASRGFTFDNYQKWAQKTKDHEAEELALAARREGLAHGPEEDILTGKDVVARTNKKPGPWMGQLLTRAREEQYKNTFTTQAQAEVWLEKELETLAKGEING